MGNTMNAEFDPHSRGLVSGLICDSIHSRKNKSDKDSDNNNNNNNNNNNIQKSNYRENVLPSNRNYSVSSSTSSTTSASSSSRRSASINSRRGSNQGDNNNENHKSNSADSLPRHDSGVDVTEPILRHSTSRSSRSSQSTPCSSSSYPPSNFRLQHTNATTNNNTNVNKRLNLIDGHFRSQPNSTTTKTNPNTKTETLSKSHSHQSLYRKYHEPTPHDSGFCAGDDDDDEVDDRHPPKHHQQNIDSNHQLSSSQKRKCPEIAQARKIPCQGELLVMFDYMKTRLDSTSSHKTPLVSHNNSQHQPQVHRLPCQQDTTIHDETYTHRQPQRLASNSLAVESDDDDAWIRNLWKRLPTFYTSAPTRQSRRRRCEIIFSVANQCKLPLDKAAALIVKTELENPHVQWDFHVKK